MLISISFVSGLRINEIEANPAGGDKGNEWVELYSSDKISLDGYFIEADDNRYDLSGDIEGVFLIEFDSQFIDNSNENIYLKNSDGVADSFESFSDSKNNGDTWQYCDSGWKFDSGTKNSHNSCDSKEEVEIKIDETDEVDNNQRDDTGEIIEPLKKEFVELSNTVVQPSVKRIVLSGPKELNYFETKEEKIRKYVVYSFMVLSVFIIILLSLRRL